MANGHGGVREGKPGAAYGNRTDLNGPKQAQKVATGQKFGAAADQKRALQAMPLPAAPVPGQVVDLLGPSQRPNEPLTAGAEGGPGPGMEALGLGGGDIDELRALYQMFPQYDELREIIEEFEEEGL